MTQYPYDLFTLTISGGGVDPETGFPTEPAQLWVFHAKCRDEVAVQQGIITSDGGETTNYSSKVLMPLGTQTIEANTQIQVRDNGKVRTAGKVLRFTPTQLHCRLWV